MLEVRVYFNVRHLKKKISSSHRQELVEQLQETREEKKRIRKNLKEFEDQFFRQNGR